MCLNSTVSARNGKTLHVCNINIWEAEGLQFQASLDHRVSPRPRDLCETLIHDKTHGSIHSLLRMRCFFVILL